MNKYNIDFFYNAESGNKKPGIAWFKKNPCVHDIFFFFLKFIIMYNNLLLLES
jgi:hypothetical protein